MRSVHLYPDGTMAVSDTNSNTTVELSVVSLKDGTRAKPDTYAVTKEELSTLLDSKVTKKNKDIMLNGILERGKTIMKKRKTNEDKS